jgi:hypothetical protein
MRRRVRGAVLCGDRTGRQPSSPLFPPLRRLTRTTLVSAVGPMARAHNPPPLGPALPDNRASCGAAEPSGLSPRRIATDPTRGPSPPLRGRPRPTPAARGCPRVACAPQRIRPVSLPPARSSGRLRPRPVYCGCRRLLARSKRPPPTGCRSSPRARHEQRHRRPPATWRAPSNTRRSARTDRVQLDSKHSAPASTKRDRT